MASASSILSIMAASLGVFGAHCGRFIYMRQKMGGGVEMPRFFPPRFRRLAFIERTALDESRKLILVRRDGGPIDLVIETRIRPEANAAAAAAKEESNPIDNDPIPFSAAAPVIAWQPRKHSLSTTPSTPRRTSVIDRRASLRS